MLILCGAARLHACLSGWTACYALCVPFVNTIVVILSVLRCGLLSLHCSCLSSYMSGLWLCRLKTPMQVWRIRSLVLGRLVDVLTLVYLFPCAG